MDIIDQLLKELPNDKISLERRKKVIKIDKKNLEKINKFIETEDNKRFDVIKHFKYDNLKDLLKDHNLIKIEDTSVTDYVIKSIDDADKINVDENILIPIEKSVLAIKTSMGNGDFLIYYYNEKTDKRFYIYLYLKYPELPKAFPYAQIILNKKSGDFDIKIHLEAVKIFEKYNKLHLLEKDASDSFMYFIAANLYIRESMKNRKTIYKKKKINNNINKSKNTNNYKSQKNKLIVMNNDKIIYEIDSDKNLTEFKRDYIRHTDSWSVRSHDRVYKSGKVVHIKAHVRGNKSVKADNKTYTIK